MRKYISLILLIIILFISNGYHLYFKYLQNNIQQEIKHKIRKGLKEKDLSIIVVSLNNEKEIEWIKKNKEFRYKGLMYDVVKTKIKINKKIYYCINDIKEKNLIANYTRHNRRRNKVLLKLKKVLSNKYLPENYSINNKIKKANVYFAEYKFFYKSRFMETLSPPPKFNFNI
jgi:hypothetical protein